MLIACVLLAGCAFSKSKNYELCNGVEFNEVAGNEKIISALRVYWFANVRAPFNIDNYEYNGIECIDDKNVMIFWVKPHVGYGHFFVSLNDDLNIIEVSAGK